MMMHRRELPPTAFPGKRRAIWFVGDIRRWLEETAARRCPAQHTAPVEATFNKPPTKRVGRPRLSAELPGHGRAGGY